jgi:hypothetical protein
MTNFEDLKEELDKKLKKCATYFQGKEDSLYSYLRFEYEGQLNKIKVNYKVIPTCKGEIKIKFYFNRKHVSTMTVTKQDIETHENGILHP